ncbi:MAG TPA: hypothetical protein VFJ30_13975 [Phycisphaerae bacterium]|nr:hypothetical protein [Phycisphaerae bacterium]
MRSKDDRPGRACDEQALAERLRRLAGPAVPPGLEEKLLAAIPRHGQPARRRRPRAWRWAGAGAAAAAGIALALLIGPLRPGGNSGDTANGSADLSAAAVERAIEREASAARLLASAAILSRHPAGRPEAAKIRDYVARAYADTAAARAIQDGGAFEQGEHR